MCFKKAVCGCVLYMFLFFFSSSVVWMTLHAFTCDLFISSRISTLRLKCRLQFSQFFSVSVFPVSAYFTVEIRAAPVEWARCPPIRSGKAKAVSSSQTQKAKKKHPFNTILFTPQYDLPTSHFWSPIAKKIVHITLFFKNW